MILNVRLAAWCIQLMNPVSYDSSWLLLVIIVSCGFWNGPSEVSHVMWTLGSYFIRHADKAPCSEWGQLYNDPVFSIEYTDTWLGLGLPWSIACQHRKNLRRLWACNRIGFWDGHQRHKSSHKELEPVVLHMCVANFVTLKSNWYSLGAQACYL